MELDLDFLKETQMSHFKILIKNKETIKNVNNKNTISYQVF